MEKFETYKKYAWMVTLLTNIVSLSWIVRHSHFAMQVFHYIWNHFALTLFVITSLFIFLLLIYEIVNYVRKQFKKLDGLATFANVNKTEVEISSMLGRYIDEMRKEQTEFYQKLQELLNKYKPS